MKRVLLGVILSMTTLAHANVETTFVPSAEIRVRGYVEESPTALTSEMGAHDYWQTRGKVGLTFNGPPATVTGHVSLITASQWGITNFNNAGASVPSTGDPAVGIHSGVGNHENLLLVNEAWLLTFWDPTFFLRVGRQNFEIANGANVAVNDWWQIPYSFDGALLGKLFDPIHVYLAFTRTVEWPRANVGNSENNPDVSVYSLGLDFKTIPAWMTRLHLNINHYTKSELNVTGGSNLVGNPQLASAFQSGGLNPGEVQTRYALSSNMMFGDFDVKLDYITHMGEWEAAGVTLERAGDMIQAELGYSFGDWRVYGLYHTDSGTSSTDSKVKTFNPYYYDRHKNAGFMDLYEWGNLTYMSFGGVYKPSELTSYGLHLHKFDKTVDTGAIYVPTPNSTNVAVSTVGHPLRTTNATESDLGMEIDLVATHMLPNGVEFLGQLGHFMPGAAYEGIATPRTDAITQFLVQARKTF